MDESRGPFLFDGLVRKPKLIVFDLGKLVHLFPQLYSHSRLYAMAL